MGTLKTLASPQLGSSAFVSVSTLELETAGTHLLETGGQEHVLNVLAGTCSRPHRAAGRTAHGLRSGRPPRHHLRRQARSGLHPHQQPLRGHLPQGAVRGGHFRRADRSVRSAGPRQTGTGANGRRRQIRLAAPGPHPDGRHRAGHPHDAGRDRKPAGQLVRLPAPPSHARQPAARDETRKSFTISSSCRKAGSSSAASTTIRRPRNMRGCACSGRGRSSTCPKAITSWRPAPGIRSRYAWVLGGQDEKIRLLAGRPGAGLAAHRLKRPLT